MTQLEKSSNHYVNSGKKKGLLVPKEESPANSPQPSEQEPESTQPSQNLEKPLDFKMENVEEVQEQEVAGEEERMEVDQTENVELDVSAPIPSYSILDEGTRAAWAPGPSSSSALALGGGNKKYSFMTAVKNDVASSIIDAGHQLQLTPHSSAGSSGGSGSRAPGGDKSAILTLARNNIVASVIGAGNQHPIPLPSTSGGGFGIGGGGRGGKRPGVVGLANLGNTCFMNSGLQCLLNTPPLVAFFLKTSKLEAREPKEHLTQNFQQLVKDVWHGPDTVIHPKDYKEALGLNFSQFKDNRQHDCQEFLTLTLDELHEQLRAWNQGSDTAVVGNGNDSSSGFASASGDQDASSSPEAKSPSSSGSGSVTHTEGPPEKKVKLEREGTPTDENENEHEEIDIVGEQQEQDEEEVPQAVNGEEPSLQERTNQAEGYWMNYIRDNNTVIASSFQGLYKSTVICSTCRYISLSFEPFMYLPLSIPRVTERKFEVMYAGFSLERYELRRVTVSVQVTDTVGKLKEAVVQAIFGELQLIVPPMSNFAVAEVIEYHICTFLRDDADVKSVRDAVHDVYVIELNQNFGDSFSLQSEESTTLEDFRRPIGPCLRPNTYLDEDWETDCPTQPIHLGEGGGFVPAAAEGCGSTAENAESEELFSCAVCLEDLPKSQLQQHFGCSCILCADCISKCTQSFRGNASETAAAQIEKMKCPVCCNTVEPQKAFVALTGSPELKKMHLISISFENESDQNDSNNNKSSTSCSNNKESRRNCIGHPILVQLPSSLTAKELYDVISSVVPFPESPYLVKNVDWQGKECGFCPYGKTCPGCVFSKEGTISVSPRNSILISYQGLSQDLIDSIAPPVMAKRHPGYLAWGSPIQKDDPPIEIYECLDTFSQTETMDGDNKWKCPQCKASRAATKNLSICRFPDYLVVYLKRFVYENNSNNKLFNKLNFPIENFDVSKYIAEEFAGGEHIYDLYSCVCHFGNANGGHYTAYSKNPKTEEWNYFNDETVSKKTPSSEEFASGYILFYARKGIKSDIP